MWIIPKNLSITYPAVADTVELEEDLNKFYQMCEKSLMWRSKPMPLQICAKRWKKVYWFQRLSGQTLKPLTFRRFEKALNMEFSVPVSHVSLFHKLAKKNQQKTLDTFGHTLSRELDNVTPCFPFWKTCKELSPQKQQTEKVFLNMSAENWKKKVIELRLEYSARQKSAHLTKEKEFLSWATPTVHGNNNKKGLTKKSGDGLNTQVKKWPTPAARDYKGANSIKHITGQTASKRGHMGQLPNAVLANGLQDQEKNNMTGKNQELWNTPKAQTATHPDYKCERKRNSPHLESNVRMKMNLPPLETATKGQRLNPNWVEQLMGLPVGWTQITTE